MEMAESKTFQALNWVYVGVSLLLAVLSPAAIGLVTYTKSMAAVDAKIDITAGQLRLERADSFVRKDDFREIAVDVKIMRDDISRIKALLERRQ